ncbi:uncharacterized protein LOC142576634 isoform X4 [Dermacentor variabilis]|uniref:uncharacterized protein LOC142576634 isoform X4 n=1 Tax=Dermacentor variabilis TaxID=34621 RepID=UPI003F5C45FB
MASPRYLLRFAYLGTRYRQVPVSFGGIQRQSTRPHTEHFTVQGAIEAALCQLGCLGDPVLVLASRTDTGVHASDSAAHVDLRPANANQCFQPQHLAVGLNTVLTRHKHDIIIRDVLQVPSWFHARHLAQWRSYRYRVAVVKASALLDKEPLRPGGIRARLPLAELNRCHVVPTLPPPHPRLSRAEAVVLRQLQPGSPPSLKLMNRMYLETYPTDMCRVCRRETADYTHILWDCIKYPEDAKSRTLPPRLEAAAKSYDRDDQLWAVQQVPEALERHGPSEPATTSGDPRRVTATSRMT